MTMMDRHQRLIYEIHRTRKAIADREVHPGPFGGPRRQEIERLSHILEGLETAARIVLTEVEYRSTQPQDSSDARGAMNVPFGS